MSDSKVLISCSIIIRGLEVTEEEKQQNEAEFKAWYEAYVRAYGREPIQWAE